MFGALTMAAGGGESKHHSCIGERAVLRCAQTDLLPFYCTMSIHTIGTDAGYLLGVDFHISAFTNYKFILVAKIKQRLRLAGNKFPVICENCARKRIPQSTAFRRLYKIEESLIEIGVER